MNRRDYVMIAGIAVAAIAMSSSDVMAGSVAEAVRSSGISGGILAHLNCGDGAALADMPMDENWLVHGLDTDASEIARARDMLRAKKLYGRVTVARYDGRVLPYADNTVNLIVADSLGDVPVEEAMRALTPLGAMVIGSKKTIKPWPDTIDDWPQYLNKADNNAVAMDSVIGPPRRLQWAGDLLWGRSHMAIATTASMVSGNGRLFAIEDRALTDNPYLPSEFSIVARNAFNGKKLWSHRITRWESVTMYIKCLPAQQQRRMAVAGDILYCTFELEGAVSAVDAASGKVLRTYENTSPCQEVAYDQGILYLNVGERFNSAAYDIVKTKGKAYGPSTPSEPFRGSGFKNGYNPEIKDKKISSSRIIAVDAETGTQLWKTDDLNAYTAASLSIKGDYAVYQTTDGLFCVNARTGEALWVNRKSILNAVGHDSKTPGTMPNTVVITDDKVFAVELLPGSKGSRSTPPNTVSAYSLKDGKLLWSVPATANYEASSDVFAIGNRLWVGGGATPTCYDADTGKRIGKLPQKMTGPMPHDRCYRNMITSKYYINSKTGGADFLDLATGTEIPNHWTRGGCGMGVLPANGLLYSTPYSCTCSIGSMFPGLNAYASVPELEKSDDPVPVERAARLERGPAYAKATVGKPAFGQILHSTSEIRNSSSWPMYRHDGARSGVTEARIAANLEPRWRAKLPGSPSAPICAGGHVFVSDVDTHTLYAVDAATGETAWTFTADGRIDSPPAYHKGMLFFGSNDGWVYCLRAADGELAWRFKDLPERLIHVRDQLESAWPVSGSVLVLNDKLYFAVGRSSFLDGGIFLYALDPATGDLLNSRAIYGPFTPDTGFPVAAKGSAKHGGFRNDILVTDGEQLYVRHRAFTQDLKDANSSKPHIMPLSGFLDGHPQHRTGWVVDTQFSWWHKRAMDILVADGSNSYCVEGFPVYHNHSYFDPRRNSYKLRAGAASSFFAAPLRKKKGSKKAPSVAGKDNGWTTALPITGKALAKAGDIIFVAGEPMTFDDPSYKNYVDAYNGRLGGRLLAVSATDGKILAEHKLNAAPVWDSIAIANGRLYICLTDGTVQCFAATQLSSHNPAQGETP